MDRSEIKNIILSHFKEFNPTKVGIFGSFARGDNKKGMKWASSDVGFMLIAYNLRRIGNILTRDQLKEYLRILISVFLNLFHRPRLKNSHLRTIFSKVSVWNGQLLYNLIPIQIK